MGCETNSRSRKVKTHDPSRPFAGGARGVSRAARFSQADLIRAMKAAEKAGYRVAGYEIKSDGSIKVELGEQEQEDWRAGSPLYSRAA